MSSRSKTKPPKHSRWLGAVLLTFSLVIIVRTFFPAVSAQVRYSLTGPSLDPITSIVPKSTDFGIVIPKIRANSRVIANVDPFNPAEYQKQLALGVAHAKGTALPGQPGNIFLFAHSASDWLSANNFNAVFYLLNKLEPGDAIYLYYKGTRFPYQVTGKRTVSPQSVEYLKNPSKQPGLTVMTCWPPGTTYSRLLVFAKPLMFPK